MTTRNASVGALLLVALAVGFLVFGTERGRSESGPLASNLPQVTGIDVSSGGYLVTLDSDESARRADLIAEAVVLEPGTPFWNTPDKTRPAGTTGEVLETDARIFTPANLQITGSTKGDLFSGQVITVNRYGGQVGEDRFLIEEPYFVEGDRIIVFLRDCSTERSSLNVEQGFGYRFVQRFVVDSNGVGSKILNHDPVQLNELPKTVESEKDNPPRSPTGC